MMAVRANAMTHNAPSAQLSQMLIDLLNRRITPVVQSRDTTFDLLAHDLLTAAFWLDIRKTQDASREFGTAPTTAWLAFRKVVPLLPATEGIPAQSRPMTAAAFLRATPATSFYAGSPPTPRPAENP
jgi:histidine ammonia-lyase